MLYFYEFGKYLYFVTLKHMGYDEYGPLRL
jgi:hypothetical protein